MYFDNDTSCSLTFGLDVKTVSNQNRVSTVVPNPVIASSVITLPYSIPSCDVVIINSIGQTIFKTIFENKNELLIGDRITTPGIYFYRVTDNTTSRILTGTFVRQ